MYLLKFKQRVVCAFTFPAMRKTINYDNVEISLEHSTALIIADHTDISPEVTAQFDSVRFLYYYCYYTLWVRVDILAYEYNMQYNDIYFTATIYAQ